MNTKMLCFDEEKLKNIGLVLGKKSYVRMVKFYMEYQHDDHPQLGDMIKTATFWIKFSWSLDGLSTFSYSVSSIILSAPINCHGDTIVVIVSVF